MSDNITVFSAQEIAALLVFRDVIRSENCARNESRDDFDKGYDAGFRNALSMVMQHVVSCCKYDSELSFVSEFVAAHSIDPTDIEVL